MDPVDLHVHPDLLIHPCTSRDRTAHEIAHGSLRLTLNEEITKEDIDYVVDQLKTIVSDLRGMSPLS